MVNRRRVQRWLSLIMPLLLAAVLFVACDAGEEGGGGGLGDETPLVDDGVGGDVDDGLGDDGLAQTPMIEPTMPVEAQPTEEATVVVEPTEALEATEEPTEAVEPTVEMTATVETDDQATPQAGAEGQAMVMLASDLIGMNIQDNGGADVGVINELLVDDSGNVQYVIVEALFVDGALDDDTATDDTATDDTTDDTATDDTATDDTTGDTAQEDPALSAGNTVALTWDAIQVETGATADTEPDVDLEDDEQFRLVYTSDMAVQEQQTFDPAILDEQGAILDDQAATDTEAAIPSEFANLLQISEYNNVNLTNNEGEDIGEIEDALIDLQEGRVLYVIVDVGGFLGIGERSVAVPFEAFQIDVTVEDDAEEESVTLDANQERLENAPEFNYDNWAPDTPNVENNWDAEWSEFWQDLETSVDS